MKNGTICVKNGTLQREKRHPCVKNGTICVKEGTDRPADICVKNGTARVGSGPYLREKQHPPRARTCVKNGTGFCPGDLREKWHPENSFA
ncbi:hypothetical protein [Hymenobacter metallicola]|uniref:Uncharacterized protein n=1 Tax=Hymenobacter metallicola TaxID=2563114 RepID=A0A4Z0PVD9_9BACT|nr:hypothetical protein [Hymenobacter metallicola]TGE20941.1 hypothetical protein E5K02_24565 [Hymenobacter metallicola]